MALGKIGTNQIDTAATPTVASATVTGDLTVDTNTLYVDSTNNRVGIGTASPDINSGLTIFSSVYPSLYLDNNSTTGGGAIRFHKQGVNQGLIASSGWILGDTSNDIAVHAGTGNALRFYTNGNNERMHIDSGGNVGIGGTPAHKLDIIGTGSQLNFNDSNSRITFAGNRALEGNTAGTNLQVGEGYTDITLENRVKMPKQPAFRAINAPVTSANGVLYWANAPLNVGGHYNTSNGRFTAPVSGNYLFTMSMLFPTTNTLYARILFAVNGVPSTLYADTLTSAGASYLTLSSSAVISLTAPDYVTVVNEGQIATYGAGYGSFCGHLIG